MSLHRFCENTGSSKVSAWRYKGQGPSAEKILDERSDATKFLYRKSRTSRGGCPRLIIIGIDATGQGMTEVEPSERQISTFQGSLTPWWPLSPEWR